MANRLTPWTTVQLKPHWNVWSPAAHLQSNKTPIDGVRQRIVAYGISVHISRESLWKKIIFTESINKSIFPYNDIEWYLYVDFETKKRSFICGFFNDQEGVKAHTSVLDIWTISNFAYCYGWDFLIQWAFCYPSLGTFLFSITSFYSAWFGFIRQIVGDDIFPQR